MKELESSNYEENLLKTAPDHTVLFAEPIFRRPVTKESISEDPNVFFVPKGSEHWALVVSKFLKISTEEDMLLLEYAYISHALRTNDVPYRMIIAHRNLINEEVVMALMSKFKVRGLSLDPSISSTTFPRDMMVDIDNIHYINPDANFMFPDNKGFISPLGEGGAVLKISDKLFVADPINYPRSKKISYEQSIRKVSKNHKVGFLPHPGGVKFNVVTGHAEEFSSNHPDRVAAAIKGRDNRDYLLVDQDYFTQDKAPWGNYGRAIEEACRRTETEMVVVKREAEDAPYSLNFEQFSDGSVVMTSGHPKLKEIVTQIVGNQKVTTTEQPIIAYPILRHGGIRCMILIAPKKIIGEPVAKI